VWQSLDDELLQRCKIFDVYGAKMESPRTGEAHLFYRIDSPDWVNVVALTKADELILVRQFRQGARAVTREIPGGMIDPGEGPAEAGARELLEETGYRVGRQVSLGSLNPNPAIFGNRLHVELALDCEAAQAIANGPTEETVVELLPLAELHGVLAEGGIDHALCVAALYAFERWRGKASA
jgi:8-oxo-dGTP pyrophosphatase MutT (NUDIX family)